MLADTFGRSERFCLTPRSSGDITSASDLPKGQRAGTVLADKAYDDDDLCDPVADMGVTAAIPLKTQPLSRDPARRHR